MTNEDCDTPGEGLFCCSKRQPIGTLVFAFSCTIPIIADAQDARSRPPEWDAKLATLRDAGPDLVPLFVLGDVNEDGKVDKDDLELVRSVVQSGAPLRRTPGLTCPAAADLNQNGRIDQRDLDLLADWVKEDGKLAIPALMFQPHLPCDFNLFFIATSAMAVFPGGTANIRFLNARLNSKNSAITVSSGDAEVTPASDGRGYVVNVRATAKGNDRIVLKVALPTSRDYFFTIAVEAAEAASGGAR